MRNIDKQLDQLETFVSKYNITNPNISKSCVGWHIEHSLLTINGITNQLLKSNPKDYKGSFKLIKIVVFATGKIPRGRGQSPKVVQPKEDFTQESLIIHIQNTRLKIPDLDNVSSDNFFAHPIFGNLKAKDTIKFIEIHTKHHLDIINDIVN